MDRLSNLLSRFGVRANLFYDGDLCGSASYDGAERRGYIHLLQAGSVTLLGPDRKDLQLTRPSLIFMPRPAKHQLFAGESDGAKLLCASMEFEGGIDNPLSASLPDCLVLALDDLPCWQTRWSGCLPRRQMCIVEGKPRLSAYLSS